jgi:hypothetical protein
MSELRQVYLDEYPTVTNPVQCQAIAESTGERCERHTVAGASYCPLHLPDSLAD